MGIRTPSRHVLLHMSALALLSILGADMSTRYIDPVPAAQEAEGPVVSEQGFPVLSAADNARYRKAFQLTKAGNHAGADEQLRLIGDTTLKGSLLAKRYLSKEYNASYAELSTWLDANADQPDAEAVYRLAMARKPAQVPAPEEPLLSKSLKGFNSGYARSTLRESKIWQAGLAAYKRRDMGTAAQYFRTLADNMENGISQDDRAAAHFWAYRALKASGERADAYRYLNAASDLPPSFYSLLASGIIGEDRTFTADGTDMKELTTLLQQAPVKRAVALKEIGEDTFAENELRGLYPRADKPTRRSLFSLARHLNLPAVQMRIAGTAKNTNDSASFPLPSWEPASGYQVERALLFAIMRQESGFNPNARSSAGAMGLMQLMPATVSAMTKNSHQIGQSFDPSINIALGQSYIEHLMSTPSIGDNLIYMMAAYNAGPGNVQNWLRRDRAESDPLLFVESIPYAQTREYVVHVIANYWVYSQLLGQEKPMSLTALAAGNWPRYEGAERQLVSMLTKVD